MISFDRVSKKYQNGFEALKQVSFDIQTGEMVFVTGHSGAGKSTLLNLISAIERPTSGRVIVNNQDIAQMESATVPFLRRKIGYIFQTHKLLFNHSVIENILLPLRISEVPEDEALNRAEKALTRVGLSKKMNYDPVMLSGGEQQRLCIARAIVNKPSILLADEPTGHLDLNYAKEIMNILVDFNQAGKTVIIVAHDDSILNYYPNHRQLILKNGQISPEL